MQLENQLKVMERCQAGADVDSSSMFPTFYYLFSAYIVK